MSAALAAAAVCGQASGAAPLPLDTIKLPPGFRIDLYAHPVRGARSLALGPGGTLFVGSRDEGKVYAVVDADKDGRADEV